MKDIKVGDHVVGKIKAVNNKKGVVTDIIVEENRHNRYTVTWSDGTFSAVSSTAIDLDPDFLHNEAPTKKRRKVQPETSVAVESSNNILVIPHPQVDLIPIRPPVILTGKNLVEDEENGW